MSDRRGASSGEMSEGTRQMRGASLLLGGRLLSKLVNFGVQIAIVRLLSKDDFGVFAYGLALSLAGELVVKFGLGRGANRFVPYHAERREYPEVMGTLGLVCLTIVALGGLGFLTLFWISGFGWSGIPSGVGARVVLILAVLAPVHALDTIGIQTLACFSRPREIFFRKHVLGPALRAGSVGVVFLLGGDAETLAYTYLGSGVVGLAICVHLALRELHAHGVLPLKVSRWRVPWRPLFRFSFPLMSTDLVYIVMTGVTTVVLMRTSGESGVAEMRAVVPAAGLIGLVVQSFSMLYMPVAMRLHARNDEVALRAHHWKSAAWAAVLSFPIFGLTFAIAPGLVPVLLGEAYAASAELLAILAIGHYISVCLAFNGDTLQVFSRTRAIVKADFLTIGISVVLAVLLCPPMGPLGASIAVTLARLSGSVTRQIILLRTPGMEGVPRSQVDVWWKVAVATLCATMIGWLWQPPFVVQVALVGILSLVLLRATARTLDLLGSFPELRRVPIVSKWVDV